MKSYTLSLVLLILFACSQGDDPQARLNALEDQRSELNKQIEKLRAEIIASGAGSPEVTKVVSLQTVTPSDFKHFIKVQGTVVSDNNILIPAQSSGIVKKIFVKEGDPVSKDQLLAELDGAIYEKTIAEIETNLELAKTVFERQQRLWDQKIGSEIQYLQAKTNKDALEKRLATVQEQYRLTKILAPISGKVDQILIKEGESAAAGFGTVRVVKITDLKIEALLSEKHINSVHEGDNVTVSVPGINREFKSRITAVSQVINAKNRTFPVEVKISSDINELKPNMLAVLTINDYSKEQAVAVPLNIVQNDGNQNFLFTAQKDEQNTDLWTVKKTIVKTGSDYDNKVEILEGLAINEVFVSVGYQNLAEGQMVRAAKQPKN